MNRSIVRLFGLVLLLFALLLAFTSRWTVFEATSLRSNHLNKRAEIERERIRRGEILAADGSVLARDVPGRDSTRSEPTWERRYPQGSEFAQALGYYFPEPGATGLERYRATALEGRLHRASGFDAVLDQLEGKTPKPDHVITTLRPAAQKVALEALGRYTGAVVALEPRTGAVEVMASSPTYDPNSMRTRAGIARVNHARNAPQVNRALQYGYAPGSTFKIVTATAAIDSGRFNPDSLVSGRNDIIVSGTPLANDENENFGDITLTEALAQSVNTVWAQVALRLGKRTLQRYMDRFGFNRKPHLDYPAEEMSVSGEDEGRLPITSPKVDLGRLGIGQDKMNATPLQMAEVAAAVANKGRLMAPHLTSRIVAANGQTVERIEPEVQSVVMKSSTAREITGMMEAVVNEGTGEPAKIPGVKVAGKTGTAETQVGQPTNNAWFIAFAPAEDPKVAVAVAVQHVPGYGATYAAPVARRVMEAVLHE